MHGLLAAAGAELLELKTIRRVTAVLRRDVVTLLALGACQRDARTNVGALACHLVHLLGSAELLVQNLRDSGGQGGLTVVYVTNCTNVNMRFGTHEFFFSHSFSYYLFDE